jgi:hypothetical protein
MSPTSSDYSNYCKLPEPVKLSPAHNQSSHAFRDDDEILTFEEWCELNKISPRTGTRVLAGPDGPIVTRLSAKRIGITRGNNAKWQRSRERRT